MPPYISGIPEPCWRYIIIWTDLCPAPDFSPSQDLAVVESLKWGKLGKEVESNTHHILGKSGTRAPSGRALDSLLVRCRAKMAEGMEVLRTFVFDCKWCEWRAKSEFLDGCRAVFSLQDVIGASQNGALAKASVEETPAGEEGSPRAQDSRAKKSAMEK